MKLTPKDINVTGQFDEKSTWQVTIDDYTCPQVTLLDVYDDR